MCDRPLSMVCLEAMNPCPNCGAPFKDIAINALLNNTALLADLNQLQKLFQEMDQENDKFRGVISAMTASTESPFDP